jgi:aryl-alcohol dehydrogenase-like predicted oxidoreductase
VDHRLLGSTGVSVSKMCLGAMMFGAWGNPDHEESTRIIHAALDAGINFIDTADVYAQGESEEIIGKALKGRRDEIVLATKFHGAMGDDPNRQGSSRRWITRAVEDSLRRLDTDWIDLYQVHRPRTDTDIEETLGALTDLVHQGKVRYIGASTFPASQIVEAQWVARERGLQRFVTEQPAYSILVRRIEDDILPTCQRHGMGVLSYSPLTGGWLSGRWRKDSGQQASSRPAGCPNGSTSPSRPTSASSTPSRHSPSSPKRPASPSSRWRSPSCSTTQRSRRQSSDRAPWSSSKGSWQQRMPCSTQTCWTGSTRSSPPAPLSTRWTTPSTTRH